MFLTRIPVPSVGMPPPDLFVRSLVWFPVVGALIGAAGGAVLWGGLTIGLSAGLAALAAVAVQIQLTGALHEDGLADIADGLGGGRDRADKLAIMRDSRVGTYGVLALSIGLLARVLAVGDLAAVDAVAALGAMVAAGSASRAVLAVVTRAMPAARSDGLAAAGGRPSRRNAGLTVLIGGAVALAAAGPMSGLIALAAGGAAGALVAWLAARQVGGYTGDILGACQQSVEISMLVALAALV